MHDMIRLSRNLLWCAAVPVVLGMGSTSLYAGVIQPVDVSAQYTLAANDAGQGLSLVSNLDGDAKSISNGNTASYGASISPDGTTVCYKSIDADGNQSAVLYDIATGTERILATAAQVGTPSIAADGTIAYTVANQLYIIPPGQDTPNAFDLGYYVNLVSISAKADSVAFNDEKDQMVVLDLKKGKRHVVTDGKQLYFAPSFSPNGKKLLARTIGGDVVTINLKSGRLRNIGNGDSPAWLNNKSIALTRKEIVEGVGVAKTTVLSVNVAGKVKAVLSETAGDANAAAGDGNFAVSSQSFETADSAAASISGIVSGRNVFTAPLDVDLPATNRARPASFTSDIAARNITENSSEKRLTNVPYIHQNNDSPDWWNGNWSCNVTAALMGIQYYNILPKHPMTATWPSPHNSDYGWYIPNTYTWNGHTFNIGSQDPNGNIGRGGYGYITQNGWEDTKGHMAEFISYHGPSSGVDWSPTIAEARSEIDDNHPFVILVSITSAGHYPLCIGYVKNQHTLIFNDPYGNKNTGYYPSADGRNVRYDWPGYNNGYSNLVTVHCFIWCRFGQPSAPSNVSASASGTTINVSWQDNSYCEANHDIYRSTSSNGTYTKIKTVGGNVTSYANSGLAGNTTYYYKVRARNPSGSSAYSNIANAKTASTAVTVIIDNTSGNFSASSNWSTGTYASDKYGSNYRFRSTEAVSDAASWSFNVPSSGSYAIYAWWSQGSNRAPSATYILPDSSTKTVNQTSGGGSWQLLGVRNLSAGSNSVMLSCWTASGSVVIADAIKAVPQ